jgi:hypothetical protein
MYCLEQLLTLQPEKVIIRFTVAAWPSSVRALKRMVNSQNGRNPCCFFAIIFLQKFCNNGR